MNAPPDAHNTAKQWAVDMLRGSSNRTEEVIRSIVGKAIQAIRLFGNNEDVDSEQLVAELLHTFSITAERGTALYDDRDHIAWLPEKRATMISWPLWERYMTYLERDAGIAPEVVNRIHADTDLILERLEDPARPGQWNRRGMVVGSVQSGKTGNYIGLINKAFDAGYKLVIVLAGRHNNLRSQTQLRIDEGVLGLDTKRERALNRSAYKIAVAHYGTPDMVVNYGTTSTEDGDFKLKRAQAFGVRPGRDPVILVIKKEPTALKNVLDWLRHLVAETKDGSNQMFIRDIPLLLIDDEADNASINTKDKRGHDTSTKTVSSINGSIRKILSSFEKSAYVGYTATPFANVFIDPDAATHEHGKDIFPESFIINIKAPSNYVGPARVFGLDGDIDAGIEARRGLGIVQPLQMLTGLNGEPADDYFVDDCFPPKHDKHHVPKRLPTKLCYAIRCFILACAARRARGHERKHNSMLVHVSRYQSVQGITTTLLREELISLQRRLREGDGKRIPTLRDELHDIWATDFVPVSKTLGNEAGKPLSWAQVNEELHPAAAKIEVMTINGFAKQVLDYKDYEEAGRSVIAVGGDKLSRGLTLEGLSISYFLRTSKMYDTLMQMGRWFGYRPDYLDLCRLFTTTQLVRWYRHIAMAEAELRREFDRMVQTGSTPANYGLRVRTHPDGMIITALNKMAHSRMQRLSYAGQLVQTAHFATADKVVRANLETVDTFLQSCGGNTAATETNSAWLWLNVKSDHLLNSLLVNFKFASENWRLQKIELIKFIRSQSEAGELVTWTVALVNTHGDAGTFTLTGCDVGITQRKPDDDTWIGDKVPEIFAAPNANIQSPSHQALDLALPSMTLSKSVLADLLAKREVRNGGPLFKPEEASMLCQCCEENVTLSVAAERLTAMRRPAGEIAIKRSRIDGGVARQLRPKTHGLLLVYLVEPRGKLAWPKNSPFVGLAFSFPTSDTANGVEYRTNKIYDAMGNEEEEDGDD